MKGPTSHEIELKKCEYELFGLKLLTTYGNDKYKVPNTKDWTNPDIDAWNYSDGCGMGIILGEVSGIMVLDCDVLKPTDDPNKYISGIDYIKQLQNDLNITLEPHQYTPSGGLHYIFKYDNRFIGKIRALELEGKTVKLDILSDKRFIVCDPTVATNGNKYMMVRGIDDIDEIPDAIADIILSYQNKEEEKEKEKSGEFRVNIETNPEELFTEHLDIITPKIWASYDHWRDLVWSISNIWMQNDRGLEIAIEYSKKTDGNNFSYAAVNKLYYSANPELIGWSKLKEICQEINKDLCQDICCKYFKKEIPRINHFEDYTINDFEKDCNGVFSSENVLLNTLKKTLYKFIVWVRESKLYVINTKSGIITQNTVPEAVLKYKEPGTKKTEKIVYSSLEKIIKKYKNDIIPFYDKIVFYPKCDNIEWFNIFAGIKGKPVEGDCQVIIDFIKEVICTNDNGLFNQIMAWCRHLVRYEKTNEAILLYSTKHGTGKNTFINFLIDHVIGIDSTFISSTMMDVLEKHADLSNKFLVNVNEVSSSKDSYRINIDKLKTLITEDWIEVNKKNIQSYKVRNFTNWIFTTNNIDCLSIPKGDRRFTCVDVNDKYVGDHIYWDKLRESFTDEVGNAFVYYLLNNNFTKVRNSYPTELKEEMTYKSSSDRFISKMKEDGLFAGTEVKGKELFDRYREWCSCNAEKACSEIKFCRELPLYFTKKHTKMGNVYVIPNNSNVSVSES